MNTKEYDQKKWECWAAFKQQGECEGGCLMADAFFHAFDRAYALGKQEKDAEDAVIQGWVARDGNGELYIYSKKPNRTQWLRWAEGSNFLPLLPDLFPDLTWESEPEPVEIIIKRKKEWIKN